MNSRKPVLLDLDGTLVDSTFHHAITWQRAFAQHGLEIEAWRCHRAIGMGADQLVPALAGQEWADEHGEAAADTESALFREMIARVPPLPGARGFLEILKGRGHPTVLASSSNQDDLDVYLELLRARELLDDWTTSDDVQQTKPEPDVIKAALHKLGDPKDGVMIGDSVHDINAAHAAGVPAIGLRTGGFGADELRDAGAESIFENLLELIAAIEDSPLA
jgi:HAD superfamily hydrolase (TIGR01509 family)